MNRNLVLATALAAGLAAVSLSAQTAPAAAPARVAPEAIPAKVAVIAFEQAVVATNEGQRAVEEINKKYEPQKAKLEAQGKEVDSLKAQLQALPANAPDDQRSKLLQDIDKKEKQLNLDGETATNSYQADMQKAYGTVAQKVGGEAVEYCKKNGFTLLMNVGGSQQTPNPVLWFAPQTDVTEAVINDFNKVSGVAAPPPSAPAPAAHHTAPAHPAPPK
jgi:outer membrane protein